MNPNYSDISLLDALQQSDEKAFASVYNQYHQAVFSNIYKLVANRVEAEDILQEVFITLWNRKHTLKPEHSIAGWLFTTSYYKSLAHIKKAIKQSIIPFTEELNESFALDDDNTFENEYIQKLQILTDAIELLPLRIKLAFKLCRLEGKSYEEIAADLNISVESAKDYVKSASRLLRRYILDKNVSSPAIGMYFLIVLLAV